MANEEQLSILKQGVKVWNEWRENNKTIKIDLSDADLRKSDLHEANLSGVKLYRCDLSGANLSKANLSEGTSLFRGNLSNADFSEANLTEIDLREANLIKADLHGSDLTQAFLTGSNLNGANLIGANLQRANVCGALLIGATLWGADLREADFGEADLSGANLWSAYLRGTILRKARLDKAKMADTILGVIDLSEVHDLDKVIHRAPSTVGSDTIQLSKGKIPEVFLRGCGLNDTDIEYAKLYNPKLNNNEINNIVYKIYELRATHAIQISPLFISYSHGDNEFVDAVEVHLNQKGIRFWRDVNDMKSGRMEKQIDRAMRLNPTVLLILSEHSLQSDWVEHEVRKAREISKETGRDILCPVALDDSWKTSPWPARVMEQIMEYNILDFSDWQNESTFERTFNKLVDGLGLFYK